MNDKLPTLKEIARRLNVSVSTVSRSLSNHPGIGLRTKMRVQALAKELSYEPNAKAIPMQSAQGAVSVADAHGLNFMDEMPNRLKYAAKLQIANEGGSVSVDGNTVVFQKCNTIIVYLDVSTNYKPDYNSGWRGADPMRLIEQEIATAQKSDFVADCHTFVAFYRLHKP